MRVEPDAEPAPDSFGGGGFTREPQGPYQKFPSEMPEMEIVEQWRETLQCFGEAVYRGWKLTGRSSLKEIATPEHAVMANQLGGFGRVEMGQNFAWRRVVRVKRAEQHARKLIITVGNSSARDVIQQRAQRPGQTIRGMDKGFNGGFPVHRPATIVPRYGEQGITDLRQGIAVAYRFEHAVHQRLMGLVAIARFEDVAEASDRFSVGQRAKRWSAPVLRSKPWVALGFSAQRVQYAALVVRGETLDVAIKHCAQWVRFDQRIAGARAQSSQPGVKAAQVRYPRHRQQL